MVLLFPLISVPQMLLPLHFLVAFHIKLGIVPHWAPTDRLISLLDFITSFFISLVISITFSLDKLFDSKNVSKPILYKPQSLLYSLCYCAVCSCNFLIYTVMICTVLRSTKTLNLRVFSLITVS